MNIKLGKYLAVLPMLSMLVACAQMSPMEARNMDHSKIVSEAKTSNDYENLANYYDKLANEMTAKVEEKKVLLEQYEDHSNHYGRRGQDYKSHTLANIRYYQEAATDAIQQAGYHRKIAAELKKSEYAQSFDSPNQKENRKVKARLSSEPSDLKRN
ncbi:hypothetical protein [Nitrosomonas supralitoralis]|uniref:DUF4398 domain-containing protein n=1 Tax=Nitrosomonas supralitoralis TaxID=2116706 RepID=A0A2P7NVF8_9PROT|nr:hypothetical protein [Nitrosomonas supralitoralis]PSJ17428.1 hypothetical protein C7H79_08045 [Nitrosomonas supralitoralis]